MHVDCISNAPRAGTGPQVILFVFVASRTHNAFWVVIQAENSNVLRNLEKNKWKKNLIISFYIVHMFLYNGNNNENKIQWNFQLNMEYKICQVFCYCCIALDILIIFANPTWTQLIMCLQMGLIKIPTRYSNIFTNISIYLLDFCEKKNIFISQNRFFTGITLSYFILYKTISL